MNQRERFGPQLTGDVLEIGPGLVPFPTGSGARVVYADKSVPGGRDATWPELAGQPSGPQADHDLDLDATGLHGLPDESFDAVVSAHVLEHLANPIAAIREMVRVLRPGGRLAIVMPERRVTFDSPRQPTTFDHLLDEHRRGVVEVSESHISEFCDAIYSQPPMHPPEVREWHNPATLDAELYALHRRRSIHVHCWNAEEFAALVAGLVSLDMMTVRLVDLYFHDDGPEMSNEYALLLEKTTARDGAHDFVRDWTSALLSDPQRDPGRAATFTAALAGVVDDTVAGVPSEVLGECLAAERGSVRQQGEELRAERETVRQLRGDYEAVLAGRPYRYGTRVATTVRPLRSLARRVLR